MTTTLNTSFQSSFSFNGKHYSSIEEMPEEVKKYFEDKNNNELPDFIDQKIPQLAKIISDAKKHNGQHLLADKIKKDVNEVISDRELDGNKINATIKSKNNSLFTYLPILLILILIIYLMLK